MIDFRVAYDKLAQFQSPEELAGFLEDEGIKAYRRSSHSCAISEWMKDTTKEAVNTTTSFVYLNIDVVDGNPRWNTAEDEVELTDTMKTFVHLFDANVFPDLVADDDDYGL